MSSLPPKFWRGGRLPPPWFRSDPILCGIYELQHDDNEPREDRLLRLERIIDYAIRARQTIDPHGMPSARVRMEIARRALMAEIEDKARLAARGHFRDEDEP